LSLIDGEMAHAAGILPGIWYGARRPPCLVPRWSTYQYVLHGKRRGARRVRRYLRRWRAREAARWKAEWIAHPFNGRFDPKGKHWRAYRDAKQRGHFILAPLREVRLPIEDPREVVLGQFTAPLFLDAPSRVTRIWSVE
jgi:hypothetical protein